MTYILPTPPIHPCQSVVVYVSFILLVYIQNGIVHAPHSICHYCVLEKQYIFFQSTSHFYLYFPKKRSRAYFYKNLYRDIFIGKEVQGGIKKTVEHDLDWWNNSKYVLLSIKCSSTYGDSTFMYNFRVFFLIFWRITSVVCWNYNNKDDYYMAVFHILRK